MKSDKAIDELLTKYLGLLGQTMTKLGQLKKDADPVTRLFSGMETLPELKERVLLYTEFLKDLKELKNQSNENK